MVVQKIQMPEQLSQSCSFRLLWQQLCWQKNPSVCVGAASYLWNGSVRFISLRLSPNACAHTFLFLININHKRLLSLRRQHFNVLNGLMWLHDCNGPFSYFEVSFKQHLNTECKHHLLKCILIIFLFVTHHYYLLNVLFPHRVTFQNKYSRPMAHSTVMKACLQR